MPLPLSVSPTMPFAAASDLVVEHLKHEVPLAFWSVTQRTNDRQVYLSVQDDAYGLHAGDSCAWSDSFCRYAVTGATPQIAPDAMSVPEYASVAANQALQIGAYVGVPIRDGDGDLFGTLCGLDPRTQPGEFVENARLLDLCATLLGEILRSENLRTDAAAPEEEATLRLRAPLRRAVEAGAIEAFYQPVVDIVAGQLVGFEALARWWHAGEMISPDVFVPIAARSGLLPALTDHMLDLAVAQLARWSTRSRYRDIRVGVNVSPSCITDSTFPDRVASCLRRHRVRPHLLTIEITEDALMHDLATAAAVSHRLRGLGVELVLDDFGTGYSSLTHLHRIPLQAMKIDRSFVGEIDTDPAAERFLRALLSLGRDLGLHVVTEGIERPGQADVLRRNGGRLAQGYLYGAPARLRL